MATKFVATFALSRRHTLGFYAPIAANLIATDSCGHTWRFFLPIATMWRFIPGSIEWRLKIARTNTNKQNGDSEAKNCWLLPYFCTQSAPGSVLKSGTMEKYGKRHGFVETQSLSWDDYRSRSMLHQIMHCFSDHSVVKFTSFSSVRCISPFEKSCDNIANLIG